MIHGDDKQPLLQRYKSMPVRPRGGPVESLDDVGGGSGAVPPPSHTSKFGGVLHEGRRRSFGGDWQARHSSKSARTSPKRTSFSKKSNAALTVALEQSVHMSVDDKAQLLAYLTQDLGVMATEPRDSGETKSGGTRHPRLSSGARRHRSSSHSPTRPQRGPLPKIAADTGGSSSMSTSSSLDKARSGGGPQAWGSPPRAELNGDTANGNRRNPLLSIDTTELDDRLQAAPTNPSSIRSQSGSSLSLPPTPESVLNGEDGTLGDSPSSGLFADALCAVRALVNRRAAERASTATFTPLEVDQFVALLSEVAGNLTPMSVRRCVMELSRSFKNNKKKKKPHKKKQAGSLAPAPASASSASQRQSHDGRLSPTVADLNSHAMAGEQGPMDVQDGTDLLPGGENIENTEGQSPSKLRRRVSAGALLSSSRGNAKNRFLHAVKRVKLGLYTNRIFRHSHQNSITTRDALLEAGASDEGLDLAAMLRILDTMGFHLTKEESSAAEKYVGHQKNGRVKLDAFEMFLSDLSATKAIVQRAKLRGEGERIFLGGSCNPTTWRKDIAIPLLEAHDVPFFNPQVDDWDPSLVAMEAEAKAEAPVLLFVIDASTRAIASMIEVVELISEGYTCVVVIHEIKEGQIVAGDIPTKAEIKDLNRARAYLADVISRHQLPVFSNIGTAVQHCITLWTGIMANRKHVADVRPAVGRSVSVADLQAQGSLTGMDVAVL